MPQYREELAAVYTNLGMIELKKKQYPQAVEDLRQARDLSDQLVAEFPTVPKHRVQSAEIDRLLAANLLGPGDAARAEQYARRSIEQLTKLAGQDPEMPSYLVASLGRAEWQLAKVLMRTNQVDAALAAAEMASGHHREALKSSPESPRYRQNLWDDEFALSIIRLKHGDVAGAAADAEELPGLCPDNPDSYVQAAFLLVQCTEGSPEQKVHLYERAMKVLGEGVNQGTLDRRGLDHPGLGPLHEREDFRRLRQAPLPRSPADAALRPKIPRPGPDAMAPPFAERRHRRRRLSPVTFRDIAEYLAKIWKDLSGSGTSTSGKKVRNFAIGALRNLGS